VQLTAKCHCANVEKQRTHELDYESFGGCATNVEKKQCLAVPINKAKTDFTRAIIAGEPQLNCKLSANESVTSRVFGTRDT